MGRLTQASTSYSFLPGHTYNVGYGYDAASHRTWMSDPQNATTTYLYDSLDRMGTLTYPSGSNYGFSYDALGRRTQVSRPNGLSTGYAYDNVSNLQSVTHSFSSQVVDGATYTYDGIGNRATYTDQRTHASFNYSYDPLYQLTQVTQAGTATETYSYDSVGNRLSSLGISPYTYNVSNELTAVPNETFTYDNNDNLLTKTDPSGATTYTWDYEDRLSAVTLPGSGGTISFKYDPFGNRIQKITPSAPTAYVYDAANLLEELDGNGSVQTRYVYGKDIDEILSQTRAGQRRSINRTDSVQSHP